jgi:hypothetical protein
VETSSFGTAASAGENRMQALQGSYRWDWKNLCGELVGLIGPWIAIDETAQLKRGDADAELLAGRVTLPQATPEVRVPRAKQMRPRTRPNSPRSRQFGIARQPAER